MRIVCLQSSCSRYVHVLVRVSGNVAGGAGGQLPPPAALKTGAPKCGEGAKITAEVCMVSQSKVSLEYAA